METLVVMRALHVLAVIHWIGGVAMVTLVLLPGVLRAAEPMARLDLFEAIEHRFAAQARVSTLVAGISGFWLTWELQAWDRFLDPASWWMGLMLVVWALFSFVLFIAEPLFLHDWFARRARIAPEPTFALVLRAHRVLLALSALAVVGAVMGSHGGL
jgi:uncharacterized membrane protein